MGLAWPLTGRTEELRFVDAAMRRAGGPRGVVLAGGPGVGKTRLAREALTAAERRGAVVRVAVGTASAQGLPLGAFAALLGSTDGDPAQVLRRATEALIADAGRAGVVVGVDDAHLLDKLSALLVHQLVMRATATVVVTVRTGEPAPDAITALWKDGLLDRLEVQPLSELETGALLEAAMGGPLDSRAAHEFWTMTRGNALYLRHLVGAERESLRLREAGGVWRWSGEPALSPGLVQLVTDRMGTLPESVRDVVDLLALGEPLGVTLLNRLTDPCAVEDAEARGLMNVVRDGRRLQAWLGHPLYGEVQRAACGQVRARRLRGRIATALASTGGRRFDDTLRRAVLALDSDLDPDPQIFSVAARTAVQRLDMPLAEQLARAAVAAGGGFDARRTLGFVLGWLGRGAEADTELATLAKLASTDAQQAHVALPRAANLFWALGRLEQAQSVLHAAEVTVNDDGARRALTALRASFYAFLAQPHYAMRSATEALALQTLPDQAVLVATYGRVVGMGVLGLADDINVAASRGYAAADRSFDAVVLGFGLCDLQIAMQRLAGYLHEADKIAHERHEKTCDAPGALRLYGVALLGYAALGCGRLRTSMRWLREARAGLAPFETVGFAFCCMLRLTQALAMAGDREAARQALAELDQDRHPAFVFLNPEIMLSRAWVAAAEGAVSEAITLAHDAASIAASQEQPAHEVLALHTAVCFGDRTVADRLAQLATRVDGPRAPAAAAQAAALAADNGDGLHAASMQLERIGDMLAAADAAAQAAAAHTRRRRQGAALAAAARAYRLAEVCEGARTPALVAAAQPLPLTQREREIVTLAAQGLSNLEIANRLVVSVRTVEGHLYRAGAKLGTSNRAELGALLHGD